MSRYGVFVGLTLLAACASAGDGPSGGPADAPAGSIDAPKLIDARPIDAPPVDLCPSGATCGAATMLGTVSGDTASTALTAMGYQSTWLRVRVTENDNDIPGNDMKITARLTSPPGLDFDVIVYLNAGSDVVECSTTVGTTTSNGAFNEVRASWGESTISNGSSDSRNVSIEIRHVSGTCAPGALWQLEVFGN